jgi:hypothetical protein
MNHYTSRMLKQFNSGVLASSDIAPIDQSPQARFTCSRIEGGLIPPVERVLLLIQTCGLSKP